MYYNPYPYQNPYQQPQMQPYCPPPNYQPLHIAFILVLFILLVIAMYQNQPTHSCKR